MTRSNLSSERGMAMIVVLMALIAGTALATVTLAAAGADMPFARESQDRKQAYAAAESGLEYYLFQLGQDTDSWTRCTTNPGPGGGENNPVNLPFTRTSPTQTDPRKWRKVPGTTAEYTIELLPPVGRSTQCTVGSAESTFLDQASGTFRIRATGRQNGVTRSIVSTMRRRSFLDFIYFTDLETADPATYATQQQRAAASANCVVPRDAREGKGCTEIQFSGTDAIRGPFHTNDDILTCGATTFGRDSKDRIEISGPNGWQNAGGCSGEPNFQGTYVQPPPDRLELPTSNASLAQIAQPDYRFTGQTTIRLNGNSMDVTTGYPATTRTMSLPPNGVIYVNNASACSSETPLLQRYDDDTACANLFVSGTYSASLTIASANDIIVSGDLRKSGDVVLGLIANNFVRVRHPVTRSDPNNADSCTNATGTMDNVTIEAAILSLAHSFIVDNYRCGARLGTLTVKGAIAQKFRGPVGTTRPTGYTKNYEYDDRLKYRSPPFFLDPVSAAWKVLRSNEQVPATR
jgi:Tfp pilus assembly protein PilX